MENKFIKLILGALVVCSVLGALFFLFKPVESEKKEMIQSSKSEEQLSISGNQVTQESSELDHLHEDHSHEHEEFENEIVPVEISNRSELIQNFIVAYLKRGGDYDYLEEVKPYCVEAFYKYLEKYPERFPLDRKKQEVDSISIYSVEGEEDIYFVDVYLKVINSDENEATDYIGYYVSIEDGKISGVKINESK